MAARAQPCVRAAHSQPVDCASRSAITLPFVYAARRSTRKKLKPPQVMRVGTTRTAWVNFKEICVMMKRTTDHVLVRV